MTRARIEGGLAHLPCPFGCGHCSHVLVSTVPKLPEALLITCKACSKQMVVIEFGGDISAARYQANEPPVKELPS